MKLLTKLFKWLIVISILVVAAISVSLGYDHYKSEKAKAEELSFRTESVWSWHDEFDRVQIQFNESIKRSILRKVSSDKSYIIYVYKNEDYSYNFRVQFLTECKPESSITTQQKWSTGQAKELNCTSSGKSLTYDFKMDAGASLDYLSENLDGFKFSESLLTWDFTKLDQEITLLKAKAPEKS